MGIKNHFLKYMQKYTNKSEAYIDGSITKGNKMETLQHDFCFWIP